MLCIIFLVDRFFFFPFGILNISSHSFLVFEISFEKSAHGLNGASWYMTSRFSLAAFKIFFLFVTFDNLITMFLCSPFQV